MPTVVSQDEVAALRDLIGFSDTVGEVRFGGSRVGVTDWTDVRGTTDTPAQFSPLPVHVHDCPTYMYCLSAGGNDTLYRPWVLSEGMVWNGKYDDIAERRVVRSIGESVYDHT
jgi:hypothetical protein